MIARPEAPETFGSEAVPLASLLVMDLPAADDGELPTGLGVAVLPAAAPAALRERAERLRGTAPGTVLAVTEHAAGQGVTPSPAALGAVDDPEATRRLGLALGDLLAACGIEVLLGPRLDVATHPAARCGTHALGDEPDLVARQARALLSGVREPGIAVCVQGAPGAGSLGPGDTAVRLDRDALEADHLVPWELAAWADAVMPDPLAVPALGPGPAALGAWMPALLEEIGTARFHGLLVAGDLPRAAAEAGIDLAAAAVAALRAGAHLLHVPDPAAARAVIAGLDAALRTGELDPALLEARHREAAERIASLRARRRWLPTPDVAAAEAALAEAGAAPAARAIGLRRARLTPGEVAVLDLRSRPEAPDALPRALAAQGLAVVTDPAWQAPPPGAAPVLALTALGAADPAEDARLRELLAARPDTIAVHTGRAETAPPAPHRVLAHGPGEAMMRAAVTALLAAPPE